MLLYYEQKCIPATSRIGGLSACNSICRATYCPSKWAYHRPRLPISIMKKKTGSKYFNEIHIQQQPFSRSNLYTITQFTWIAVQSNRVILVLIGAGAQEWNTEITMRWENDLLFRLDAQWRTSCCFHNTSWCTFVFVHCGAFTILCFPCMVHLQAAMEFMTTSLSNGSNNIEWESVFKRSKGHKSYWLVDYLEQFDITGSVYCIS